MVTSIAEEVRSACFIHRYSDLQKETIREFNGLLEVLTNTMQIKLVSIRGWAVISDYYNKPCNRIECLIELFEVDGKPISKNGTLQIIDNRYFVKA